MKEVELSGFLKPLAPQDRAGWSGLPATIRSNLGLPLRNFLVQGKGQVQEEGTDEPSLPVGELHQPSLLTFSGGHRLRPRRNFGHDGLSLGPLSNISAERLDIKVQSAQENCQASI